METKDDMIQKITQVLYTLDNGTVNVLYRIICGKRKRWRWRLNTEKG